MPEGLSLHRHLEDVAAFAGGLTSGELPPGLTARFPDEAARRFAVYRNNVAHSLTAALAQRFPVIRRLVGEAFFDAMALIFVAAHRPSGPVLHEWGAEFPAFLEGFPPLADYPYMADVARIELARGIAFHAADARPAQPDSFAGVDPALLRLRLHPSVQVLRLSCPAVSIWAMNQPGAQQRPLDDTRAEIALVLRDPGYAVPVREIGDGDAVLIAQTFSGATLTEAAEAAMAADPRHDPKALVLHLMQSGAIIEPEEAPTCVP